MKTSSHWRAWCALSLALSCTLSTAAPFVPQSDDEVVEQLPKRWGSSAERQAQREARLQLQREPAQLPLALSLAQQAITRARQQGDPRELGQAQAVLAPWWKLPDPPAPVRLMRAIVRQSQHHFDEALQDLDQLVTAPAGRASQVPLAVQAQAELTRASVLQVQGRWRDAQAGCERLASERFAALGDGTHRAAQVCLAELQSLQGQLEAGAGQLKALVQKAPASERTWLALVQAELAERQGSPQAEALYQQATRQAPEVYALAAYADWLLGQRRPAEVVQLLQGREQADALLLRWAIALQQAQDPRASEAIHTLRTRFAETAQRGDTTHARERARFALDLQADPATALREAQTNWATQKEPADAVLLVRAALAARQAAQADPVWAFVQATGLQDVRLSQLKAGLGSRP